MWRLRRVGDNINGNAMVRRAAIFVIGVADFLRSIWTCVEFGPPNFRSINLELGSVYGQFEVSSCMVSLALVYG